MRERFERDGVGLYFRQEGSGDPPIVFVHGWCCDHTFFQPQWDHFKSNHSVTALDLRGCGRSDKPEDGYDFSTMADDLGSLCRELELSKPVVVGHSSGGLIALELAAREPSIAGGIVAVDPGPIHPTPEMRSFYEDFLTRLDGPDGEGVRRTFVENMLPHDHIEWSHKILETMTSTSMDVARATMRASLDWDGAAALALCRVPLLVTRPFLGGGREDPSRLLAVKPGIQLGVTVGAGHFHQLEVPQQINAMIERFVELAVGVS